MTSCLTQPPTTLDAFLDAIDRCATLAGGPQWQSLALTGLAAVVVLAFAVLLVGALVVRRL